MIAVCLSWMMSFPAKRNIFVELMSTPFFYKCIRQIRTKMKPKVLTSIKKEKRKVQTLVQLYIEWTYCCPACFNLQSKQQILIWIKNGPNFLISMFSSLKLFAGLQKRGEKVVSISLVLLYYASRGESSLKALRYCFQY